MAMHLSIRDLVASDACVFGLRSLRCPGIACSAVPWHPKHSCISMDGDSGNCHTPHTVRRLQGPEKCTENVQATKVPMTLKMCRRVKICTQVRFLRRPRVQACGT